MRLPVGDAVITRVGYFDVALPPEGLGLTADDISKAPWAIPHWATADGSVLVGEAVWVVESEGALFVVDPCGAADEFIRTGVDAVTHQEAVLAAVQAAGFRPDRVDAVVLTHLDGIGMAAVVADDGRWVPAFPNARVIVTARELAYLQTSPPVQGIDQFRQLVEAGFVDGVESPHRLTREVTLALTGGHTPGHGVVRVESAGSTVVMIGHLAVTPLHVAAARRAGQHADAERAATALDVLLRDGALLIGSLWPDPGVGTVTAPGVIDPYRPNERGA